LGHQPSWGRGYSEIKHRIDSCWRITEKNEIEKAGKRNDQRINCIMLKNKSLIVVQDNQTIYFAELLKHQKLSEFNQNQ
jgi:hypothetical protein